MSAARKLVPLHKQASPTFGDSAAAIAANGYAVVPVLPGQKRVVLTDWPNYRFAEADLAKFAAHGIGILTRHTPAVDNDVRDAVVARRIDKLIEDKLGPAPERVGQAPKTLRPYRLEGGVFKKKVTRGYRFPTDAPGDKTHKVEVLADGQQFVAHNIHPDTGKPYSWNGHGEPLTVPVDNLPSITESQAAELIVECEKILAEHGTPVGKLQQSDCDRSHEPNERQKAKDPQQLRAALEFIKNDDLDYGDWIYIGLALKGALGEEGLEDWMGWSAQSDKHDDEATLKAWNSLKPDCIGAGTIFHFAKEAGWVRPSTEPRKFEIEIRAGFEAEALAEVNRAMPTIADAEGFMLYGGHIVRPYLVERQGFGGESVTVQELNVLSARALGSHIGRQIAFQRFVRAKEKDGGDWVKKRSDVPLELIQTYLERKDLVAQLPQQVDVMASTPIIHGGQLITANGFHLESRAWIHSPSGVELPAELTKTAAAAALAYLRSWLAEFPFARDEAKAKTKTNPKTVVEAEAAGVALLLTAAIRASVPHAPLFAVNKHTFSEGGSTLCSLGSIVQTARLPAVITVAASGDQEIEKRIDAAQIAGRQNIVLDNWAAGSMIASTAVGVMLTESRRDVRVLGLSKNVECTNTQLLLANGVNITVAEDMVRRTVEIRLDSRLAEPDTRTFKRPTLLEDAMRERSRILSACFTIALSFQKSGSSAHGTHRAGFDGWSRFVVDPLVWLGLPDVGAVPAEMRTADPTTGLLTRLLPEWEKACELLLHPEGLTVAQVIDSEKLSPSKLGELSNILGEATGAKFFGGIAQLQPVAVGKFLGRVVGQRVGDQRLMKHSAIAGTKRWRVEKL